MAVYQTDYDINLAAARPGQIANDSLCQVDSRICKEADGIGFGLAVVKGDGDRDAQFGDDASRSADFVGITVKDVTVYPEPDRYDNHSVMGVLTQGDIWVTAGAAVEDGQDVVFDPATGALSSEAQATTTGAVRQRIAGARWMTTAAKDELAIVRLTGALGAANA